MIENKLVKKMAASLIKKQKNVFVDRRIMHPEREWFTGLLLSAAVLVGGVSFMVFQYFQFSHVSTESAEVAEEGVVYRSGLVKDALDDFRVRKNTYEELKKELIGSRLVVEKIPETANDVLLPEEVILEEVPVVIEDISDAEKEIDRPTLSI